MRNMKQREKLKMNSFIGSRSGYKISNEGRGGGGRKRREREKMSKDGGGKVGKETGRK